MRGNRRTTETSFLKSWSRRTVLVAQTQCRLAQTRRKAPKAPFTVLAGDDHFADLWFGLLKSRWGSHRDISLLRFKTDTELVRLARDHFFDLICVYLGNIHRAQFKGPRPGNWLHNSSLLDHIVQTLSRIKRDYGKPIIALQGIDRAAWFEGTGVAFLQVPFQVADFWSALED